MVIKKVMITIKKVMVVITKVMMMMFIVVVIAMMMMRRRRGRNSQLTGCDEGELSPRLRARGREQVLRSRGNDKKEVKISIEQKPWHKRREIFLPVCRKRRGLSPSLFSSVSQLHLTTLAGLVLSSKTTG